LRILKLNVEHSRVYVLEGSFWQEGAEWIDGGDDAEFLIHYFLSSGSGKGSP
jgi:hypothetical protein